MQTAVNFSERAATMKNHTATHLLHQALKDVLGEHVEQAGSLVEPERLRFDFSHYEQIASTDLQKIEEIVNEKIAEALHVMIMDQNFADAKRMGATALFGEKYGDVVRVVDIDGYSVELCGGCHVENTSHISLFRITSETGIGAGVRRIEAVTAAEAYHHMSQQVAWLQQAAEVLHTTIDEVPQRIMDLQEQYKALQKAKDALEAKEASQEAKGLLQTAEMVNGVSVIAQKVQTQDMDNVRAMVDDLKDQLDRAVIVLGMAHEDKVQLIAGVTKDLTTQGYHAGNLIKEMAAMCGGGGGGRPDLAQAGGKKPEQLPEALQYVSQWVASLSE